MDTENITSLAVVIEKKTKKQKKHAMQVILRLNMWAGCWPNLIIVLLSELPPSLKQIEMQQWRGGGGGGGGDGSLFGEE